MMHMCSYLTVLRMNKQINKNQNKFPIYSKAGLASVGGTGCAVTNNWSNHATRLQ
jgi:hypothetical protein